MKTTRSGKRYPDGSLPPEVWTGGVVCPTLNAFDSGDSRATVIMVETGQGWWKEDVVAGTLRSEGENRPSRPSHVVGVMGSVSRTLTHEGADASEDGTGRGTPVVTASTVRRLTPTECEALQGFPRDWTAGQADSHRYKQMGNAVSVPVVHYVASLIDMALRCDDGPGTV